MQALDHTEILGVATYLAGSYCSMSLADLSADVIKMTSLSGDPARYDVKGIFMSVNRGKKSLALDLESKQGQDVFHKFVSESDFPYPIYIRSRERRHGYIHLF